jgi:site-specific DNA-methyltransferase (adenine-specific)
MISKVHFSSANQDWKTPALTYAGLNAEFDFDFDPCPVSPKFDGLAIDWGKRNFVNPPYKSLKLWVEKSWLEFKKGKLVVMLIPARTDTIAFHQYCIKAHEIRFIKGRLCFNDNKKRAPFPSMIVIFKPKPGGERGEE